MKKSLIAVLLITVMLLMACGKESYTPESTVAVTEEATTGEVITEEPTSEESTTETPTEAPTKGVMEDDGKDLEPIEMMKSVMLGKHSFIDTSSNNELMDITYYESVNSGKVESIPFEWTGFTVVDLDGDGIDEVIADVRGMSVSITSYLDSLRLIFHYEDGNIYLSTLPFGEAKRFFDTGVIYTCKGAFAIYWYRISFENGKVVQNDYIAEIKYGRDTKAVIEGKDASEDEYESYVAEITDGKAIIEGGYAEFEDMKFYKFTEENIEKYIVGEN